MLLLLLPFEVQFFAKLLCQSIFHHLSSNSPQLQYLASSESFSWLAKCELLWSAKAREGRRRTGDMGMVANCLCVCSVVEILTFACRG